MIFNIMKKFKKHTKLIAYLSLICFLFLVSTPHNTAFGAYEYSTTQSDFYSNDIEQAGEPAAVAVALAVGAAFVVASGVAFVVGVFDGISGRGEIISQELHPIENLIYNPIDFSGFDI
ncbi:hypothetical protein P872_19505 [Rhodonellum psychrophilum GCM71 = DSM 17998]|uniref:Uncharacterized protein n=2 Tax=Rhodonellum TaxID=336827 RepID=U5BMF7_9BACT|nr:hypothetical protein P872_19505 [Rhodonellum psychrophilum GCM71 = DSM 17998]